MYGSVTFESNLFLSQVHLSCALQELVILAVLYCKWCHARRAKKVEVLVLGRCSGTGGDEMGRDGTGRTGRRSVSVSVSVSAEDTRSRTVGRGAGYRRFHKTTRLIHERIQWRVAT